MKKKIVVSCLLAISSVLAFGQKVTDNFTGKWKTSEGKMVLVTGDAQQGFDGVVENKDITVLKDVRFSSNKWTGWIIRPTDGMEVKCEVLLDDDKLRITAKKGMFSKEIIWKRP